MLVGCNRVIPPVFVGDIIFAVDGQSTEDLSHEQLVDKIKVSKSTMR